MKSRPTLQTHRLCLRPLTLEDAPRVQQLASDKDIARTTLTIPHPYPDGAAAQWIGTHQERFEKDELVNFAIARKDDGALLGVISLKLDLAQANAELGYWIGKPFWNHGYTTEAAKAVLAYGFKELKLHRIYAHYMAHNPASGRVMEKIGMTYEGRLRGHILKWGTFYDVVAYSILADEFQANR